MIVDWGNRVINIEMSDLTHIAGGMYRIDIYDLHLALRDKEDDDDGMSYPTTHSYTKPLTVGGTVIARVLEIINDYTVTFEDGAYMVDIVGGNSNIMDVLNFNSVSVRSNNSAGLIEVSTGTGSCPTKEEIADAVWGYNIP